MSECGKCGGRQEEGFILDESYGSRQPSQWYEGTPEPSMWTGTKTKDVRSLHVRSLRCTQCGYLENYAN